MLKRQQLAALVFAALTLQVNQNASADSGLMVAVARRSSGSQQQMQLDTERANQQAMLAQMAEAYFTACFRASPNYATESGIHDFDDKMFISSPKSFSERIEQLKQFRTGLQSINSALLDKDAEIDLQMLINDANAQLLSLESIQEWKHNPDHYSSRISSYIFSMMKRDFAPLKQRLRHVIAREKQVPEILENARANLEGTPKVYTEVALEQLPGIIEFFQTAVPAAFASVDDAQLKAEFDHTNDEVIRQLKIYQSYLQDEVLPRSTASFAIGKENYAKKLLYEEMVDEPLEAVLQKGYGELHRLQGEFVATAKEIDPNKSTIDVYTEIASQHPAPSQLLSAVQGVLADLKSKSLPVVTIPSEDELKVQETPPFMRATTFASMDAPGPFERSAKEAYYNVTLPEKTWDAQRTEQHMRFFCTLDLINTSVHEAYPGHYVQGLWAKKASSKSRKLLSCGTNVEGWAHYCEQMMVEVAPVQDRKLKLVQLHDALLRACRYVVGIEMHTGDMTQEQAKEFFIKEGYQEPANAVREAKRGTSDPTYLVYTLGKLQILALRDEYKQLKGKDFNLKEFHDRFLAEGYAPVKLIRQKIISPALDAAQASPSSRR